MTLREQPVHTVPHFGELFCSTRVTPPVVNLGVSTVLGIECSPPRPDLHVGIVIAHSVQQRQMGVMAEGEKNPDQAGGRGWR